MNQYVVAHSNIAKCTLNQVLYFTLKRQGLIQPLAEIESTLFPLHATSHKTPVLSLISRVNNSCIQEYIADLKNVPGNYMLTRSMRGTLHIIPTMNRFHDTVPVHNETVQGKVSFKSIYEIVTNYYNCRGNKLITDRCKKFGMSALEYDYFTQKIYEVFQENDYKILSISEITNKLKDNISIVTKNEVSVSKKRKRNDIEMMNEVCEVFPVRACTTDDKTPASASNVSIVLYAMHSQNLISYGVSECTNWLSSTRSYGIAKQDTSFEVTGSSSTEGVDSNICQSIDDASTPLQDLLCWYFHTYGPASLEDFIWWAGKPKKTQVRSIIEKLIDSNYLSRVNIVGFEYMATPSKKTSKSKPKSKLDTNVSSLLDMYIPSALLPELTQIPDGEAFESLHGENIREKEQNVGKGRKDNKSVNRLTVNASTSLPIKKPCIRLLPYEDALIKGYKETRYRFFYEKVQHSEDNNRWLFRPDLAMESCFMGPGYAKGEAYPSVWLDGRIIGGWSFSLDTDANANTNIKKLYVKVKLLLGTLNSCACSNTKKTSLGTNSLNVDLIEGLYTLNEIQYAIEEQVKQLALFMHSTQVNTLLDRMDDINSYYSVEYI